MFKRSISHFAFAHFRSIKNSSNVLKLMHDIQVYYIIFHTENGIHMSNGQSIETHKSILIQYDQWAKIF